MKKYLNIDEQLLQNKSLSFLQVGILSYLKRFQINDNYCFQSKKYISEYFNTTESTFKRELKKLQEMKLLFSSNDKKYLIPFNNRKALILVDENNPFPTTEINSNELSTLIKEDISIKMNYTIKTNKSYQYDEEDIKSIMSINEYEREDAIDYLIKLK
jgi:hypothetical protein